MTSTKERTRVNTRAHTTTHSKPTSQQTSSYLPLIGILATGAMALSVMASSSEVVEPPAQPPVQSKYLHEELYQGRLITVEAFNEGMSQGYSWPSGEAGVLTPGRESLLTIGPTIEGIVTRLKQRIDSGEDLPGAPITYLTEPAAPSYLLQTDEVSGWITPSKLEKYIEYELNLYGNEGIPTEKGLEYLLTSTHPTLTKAEIVVLTKMLQDRLHSTESTVIDYDSLPSPT